MNEKIRSVYVVEDEAELADLVKSYLVQAGYEVTIFLRGDTALERFRQQPSDLLVLDLMLPGKDGLTVCKEIRAFSPVPIIMVTARVEEVDRLLGLELGADDYLCKPFSPRELVARIKVIFRRMEPGFGKSEQSGRLTMDEQSYAAKLDGNALNLTPLEFRLLQHLVKHVGRVYSRAQLLEYVYEDNRVVTDRTVDSHIKNIRKKIKEGARKDEEFIHSIYGLGYKFDWP